MSGVGCGGASRSVLNSALGGRGNFLGAEPPRTEALPPQEEEQVALGHLVPTLASPTHPAGREEGLVNRSQEKQPQQNQRTTWKVP